MEEKKQSKRCAQQADENYKFQPIIDSKGFRTPFAHRRGRLGPRVIISKVKGSVKLWKKERMRNRRRMAQEIKQNMYEEPVLKDVVQAKLYMQDSVLEPFELGSFRRVYDVDQPRGRKELEESELWPNGPKWKDLSADQVPDLPGPQVGDADASVGHWDLYLTDYNPNFWLWFGECGVGTVDKVCL